jgi:hypothetical protein
MGPVCLCSRHTLMSRLHPYFDEKTDKDLPTWMMVDVKFIQRLAYPPTLALVKHLATLDSLPEGIAYIGDNGLKAVQSMHLVNRGRLSEYTPGQR